MPELSYDAYKDYVKDHIKEYLPDEFKDAKISIAEVTKIGSTYDSLTVRPDGQMASPAANLNAFYEDYINGEPFEMVMYRIADVIQTEAPAHMKDMKWLLDYDQAKEHLFIRVSNAKLNPELLDKAPHKIQNDLVITCHIAISNGPDGMASTIVNNDLITHYGIDEKQLFKDAMEKSPEVLPVKIDTMLNVISGMMPEAVSEEMTMDQEFPGSQMLIVTNQAMVNGAAAIFYPGVLDEISEKIGGNFVVLPSSVNEVIILPDAGDYKHLEAMVREINVTVVDPKEFLSNHVYKYDKESKELQLANPGIDRSKSQNKGLERE